MSVLLERVKSLQNVTGALLNRHQQLQHKIGSLTQENSQLKQENEELKQLVESWETRYSTLKAANAMLGSNDYKRETKLKINAMMREIDACIAQLAD